MPKEVYLNMTELAKLFVKEQFFFSGVDNAKEARAFFDVELKKQGQPTLELDTQYGRFYHVVEHSKPLARIMSDMKYAKSKPDSVMAKRFLRDLYQIVYYMLGDERSGFKPEYISDKAVLDKVNLIRMNKVKSLTEKLQLALNSESIDLFTLRSVTNEFAAALHNDKPHAYDKKLVDLVEKKLIKTAEAEIKTVDLSPDGMDSQAYNLTAISRLMSDSINNLYPDKSAHKTELLKDWDELAVSRKAYALVQHPEKEQAVIDQPKQEIETPKQEIETPKHTKQEAPQTKVSLFKRAANKLKNRWLEKNIQTIGKDVEK